MTKNDAILPQWKHFIEKMLFDIQSLGIEVSGLHLDHIAYQASSDDDYDRLKIEFHSLGSLISEEIVNGRRVGIYELAEPLHYKDYVIEAFELIAPKKGQQCPSGLEHVEFVLKERFETFMGKYPQLSWDTSAMYQTGFPMIKVTLSPYTQVKFHLTPVLDIVKKK